MTISSASAAVRGPTFALPAAAPAAARVVFGLLGKLTTGTLDVQMPDGSLAHFGGAPGDTGPRASLRLNDWRVCSAALKSGDIGFAETFIDGGWTSPDLVALLTLFIANRTAINKMIFGSWWGSLAYRLKHLLNRNSRQGSRKNIHAHYDIGNPFYRLWLDETMNYSSALFEGDLSRPTAEAQAAKVRRALRECGVQPGQRVLEIGCGWGGFAVHAAKHHGCRVTGVTISEAQAAYARQRVADEGLEDRIEIRIEDYRHISGKFDKIASIEMLEAVGDKFHHSFFAKCAEVLTENGLLGLQMITVPDCSYASLKKNVDWIQKHIFPGSLLCEDAVELARALQCRR